MTTILAPPQAAPVMQIARELLPPRMKLVVVDPSKPAVARRVEGFDMDGRHDDILRLTEDQEDALQHVPRTDNIQRVEAGRGAVLGGARAEEPRHDSRQGGA